MLVSRSVTEVGPGDWVLIDHDWKQILANTAFRAYPLPRTWEVTTTDGEVHDMWGINAYAKDGDSRLRP